MTLLVTVIAAIVSTLVWYLNNKRSELKIGILCLTYWGAALMWFVDAIFEFVEMGVDYFNPEPAELLNDLILGFSAVILGLVAWIVILLFKDPKGVIRQKHSEE